MLRNMVSIIYLWKTQTHNHYIFCVDIKELNETTEFLSYENFWKALKNLLRPVTYRIVQNFDGTFFNAFRPVCQNLTHIWIVTGLNSFICYHGSVTSIMWHASVKWLVASLLCLSSHKHILSCFYVGAEAIEFHV